MKSKICGIFESKVLEYITNHTNSPQYIGFIVNYPKSKRFISHNKLKDLLKIDNKKSEYVAVLVQPDKNILEIHENIKPERNLLIAALQNNLAFHDVNPIKYIEGSRNAFYLAISTSIPVWKSVKGDNFNLKYNKNRVKLGLIQKIKKKFLK